jgi:hypothetical protein
MISITSLKNLGINGTIGTSHRWSQGEVTQDCVRYFDEEHELSTLRGYEISVLAVTLYSWMNEAEERSGGGGGQ